MILIQNTSYPMVNADKILTNVELLIKDKKMTKIGQYLSSAVVGLGTVEYHEVPGALRSKF